MDTNAVTAEISIENLFSMVTDMACYMYEYPAQAKHWHQISEREKERYFQREYLASITLTDLCQVLNLDVSRLLSMERISRKWEEKNHYEHCFPWKDCERQIWDYLRKEDADVCRYQVMGRLILRWSERDNRWFPWNKCRLQVWNYVYGRDNRYQPVCF